MSSWLCFLSLHPSWRPQEEEKIHKKKGKMQKPAFTTLHDAPGFGGATPIQFYSVPNLGIMEGKGQ